MGIPFLISQDNGLWQKVSGNVEQKYPGQSIRDALLLFIYDLAISRRRMCIGFNDPVMFGFIRSVVCYKDLSVKKLNVYSIQIHS